MQAIKVGDERVVLSNVTNVNSRISKTLIMRPDGSVFENWDAKDENRKTGLVVTVHFVTGIIEGDYVRFYTTEAEEFLAKFDKIMGVE